VRFPTLDDWLRWQETLHPARIELGLDRVGRVAERLELLDPRHPVVTVAGTNGKGSSVAMLDSVLRAAGYRVGAYTSPHLLHYTERIRIDGLPAQDAVLCEAFERIDRARGEISLSYFEFGTLAALLSFQSADLDVALLEVGLGGRLDAVNLLDPDIALITSIGLDHQAWLGDTREAIGREKAGIMRPARPVVCADPEPPDSIAAHARDTGARLLQIGSDFGYDAHGQAWDWWGGEGHEHRGLPRPALSGAVQLRNAAGIVMVLERLHDRLPVARAALDRGLEAVVLAGRFQRLPGSPECVLDVAHNPDSVAVLSAQLREHPVQGDTIAVIGVLDDKDLNAMLAPLRGLVARWHVAAPDTPRARPAEEVRAELCRVDRGWSVGVHADVAEAYRAARACACDVDRILVFGSFYTVAEVLALNV
jgi:dihydrofolate synthase/folylpolyglutamate synthase